MSFSPSAEISGVVYNYNNTSIVRLILTCSFNCIQRLCMVDVFFYVNNTKQSINCAVFFLHQKKCYIKQSSDLLEGYKDKLWLYTEVEFRSNLATTVIMRNYIHLHYQLSQNPKNSTINKSLILVFSAFNRTAMVHYFDKRNNSINYCLGHGDLTSTRSMLTRVSALPKYN